jgi:hypothetical protein
MTSLRYRNRNTGCGHHTLIFSYRFKLFFEIGAFFKTMHVGKALNFVL